MTASAITTPTGKACAVCGEPVPKPKRGPTPDYCTRACRQAAYRRRHEATPEELRERARLALLDLSVPAPATLAAGLAALDGSVLVEAARLAENVATDLRKLIDQVGITAAAVPEPEPVPVAPTPTPTTAAPTPTTPPGAITPTAEQYAIIEAAHAGKHLVIQAGAGTGKTSTLKMVARAALGGRRALYVAYNKSIATEAKASFPSNVQCSTAHSLAFGAVGRRYRDRLNQNGRQPARQVANLLKINQPVTLDTTHLLPDQLARIVVDTVKRFCYSADQQVRDVHVPFQHGIVGQAHDDLATVLLPYARRAWEDVQRLDGTLKFEHDYYLKMWALTRPELPADVVMLDEAQDSNPVVADIVQSQRHAQRIAVGDSCQQLYAWRGAVDALDTWEADARLYLSQSWRFGPAIAEEANKWLRLLRTRMRLLGAPHQHSELLDLAAPRAILCRTNGEAVAEVMKSLAAQRRVAMIGGGTQIRRLAEAARDLQQDKRTSHPELYVFDTWAALQDYVELEPAGRDLKPFVDLIDEHGVEKIIHTVDALVDEKRADVIVGTAHKSKGREWTSVRIAGDFREPKKLPDGSPAAGGTDLAMLAYVAVTRARQQLDRTGLEWIDNHNPSPLPA